MTEQNAEHGAVAADLTVAEVYEIVDRLTNKRANEVIYGTTSAALDQLAKWVEQYGPKVEKTYRVQGVLFRG